MAQNFSRPKVIAGNWKMYKTIDEARSFVETLAPLIQKSQAEVYLSVPFTAIYPTLQRVQELKAAIVIGAQNMNDASQGAFTGEIAGKMIKEAGASFVILGHSERRRIFHEKDDLINRKVLRAIQEGIRPLLCIGETLEERENNQVEEVLRRQLEKDLHALSNEALSSVMIAYEPVWAIGTGRVATTENIEAAHRFCRQVINELWGDALAQKITILYGGSVKPDNVAEMVVLPDVDGFLVGGASLKPEEFYQIIQITNENLSFKT